MPESEARRTRVLLVEDDPGFQLLIQRILERLDPPAQVETVEDGPSAVRLLAQDDFDLVLMDYSLPGRTGLEILKEISDDGMGVPVVMVTGMGNEQIAVEALKAGAYDYLVKSGDLKTALPLVVQRVIEKVRLEDGLRKFSEENARLRELDRLKSQFIANVSHELRTPLVSISGYTDMMLSEHLGELNAEQRKAMSVCSRNAERLKVLIDNILNLSSLEAHRVKPVIRPFDIHTHIRDRLDAARPSCLEHSITLQADLSESSWVLGDSDLIEQVMWNLLSNAVKFTPEGGRIEVSTHLDRSQTQVVVEVADTGCGIAEEQIPRIFERFWQADASPTRRYEGLGIGLSIVKEILDAHDTAMHVRSTPGRGSVFTFSLPRGDQDASPPPEAKPVEAAPGRRLNVLIVDDEADTREFVRAALEMIGHRVLLAEGGRDGLNVLGASPVDVVLLDVAMADMSGVDVLHRIRNRPDLQGLPVLMLTAIADPLIKEQCARAGATEILEKPLRTSELVEAVTRHTPDEAAP